MKDKNIESETGERIGNAVPVSTSGIGTRIKFVVDQLGTRQYAAEVAGVSEDMLYRYMREKSAPSFEPMARLAQASGIRLEWIATGRGSPETAPSQEAGLEIGEIEAILKRQLQGEHEFPLDADAVDSLGIGHIKQRLIGISADPDRAGAERAAADKLLDLVFGQDAAARRRESRLADLGGRLRRAREEVEEVCSAVGYQPGEGIRQQLQTLAFTGVPAEHILGLVQALKADSGGS